MSVPHKNFWFGLFLVLLFASLATYLATFPFFKNLAISPLIVGILLGMIFGNTFRQQLPHEWSAGIIFSAKKILRLAIIFYGFRITFQQISAVGIPGLVSDLFMLTTTFLLGSFVGIKFFKMDEPSAFLCASGASVCGAAAVLATEPVVKADMHKTAIALTTVVFFGTISMFLFPLLYKSGILNMDYNAFGIYIGASVHEVAQVVGAGNAISQEAADTGVIVKMTRVMLLVPLLLVLSFYISSKNKIASESLLKKIKVPWFAVGFILVSAFNSLEIIPKSTVQQINMADTFLLTMAMTALGMETNFNKFRTSGGKPFLLAFIMFLWLVIGGCFFSKLIS